MATAAIRSLRLTYEYREGNYEVVGARPTSKPVPMGDDVKLDFGERSGFWFELQDAEGRPLYRRTIRHPVRAQVEVVADDDGGFTNSVSVADRAMFELAVPSMAGAVEVVLFSSSLERPQSPDPARPVHRHALLEPGRPDRPDEPGQRNPKQEPPERTTD